MTLTVVYTESDGTIVFYAYPEGADAPSHEHLPALLREPVSLGVGCEPMHDQATRMIARAANGAAIVPLNAKSPAGKLFLAGKQK